MSDDENGADPSYVGNDDVNTFYGDVIVAYPVPVVRNGIAQSLYYIQVSGNVIASYMKASGWTASILVVCFHALCLSLI